MWVFLGLTIDFSEIRVFANKGCTETHLICVSQTLTRFSYSLLDGLASTSRGLLLLNLLFSFFFFFFFFFFRMPHFPTCITKCVLQSILAIFRSPDRKKKMKRKDEEEKRKTKINSGSTADRCTELKTVFDPSALKAQSNCGFVSE